LIDRVPNTTTAPTNAPVAAGFDLWSRIQRKGFLSKVKLDSNIIFDRLLV
jgi:hypothetical protein